MRYLQQIIYLAITIDFLGTYYKENYTRGRRSLFMYKTPHLSKVCLIFKQPIYYMQKFANIAAVGIFFCCITVSVVNANDNIFFDIDKANQQFEEIVQKLSKSTRTQKGLNEGVKKLETLQKQAQNCIDKAQDQLNTLNKLLGSNSNELSFSQDTADYQYLQNKRNSYVKQAAECRLFVFRSEEIINSYKQTIQLVSKSMILHHSTPIWEIVNVLPQFTLQDINLVKLYNISGIEQLDIIHLSLLLIVIIIGSILGAVGYHYCNKWITTINNKNHLLWLSAVYSLRSYIIPLFIASLISLYFTLIYLDNFPETIEVASNLVTTFIFLSLLIKFVLVPPPFTSQSYFHQLPRPLALSFYKRLMVVFYLMLVGYLVACVFREQQFTSQLLDLIRTLYITVLNVAIVWFLWLLTKLPKIKPLISLSIKILLSLLLLVVITTEWLGFHQLTVFLIDATLLSVLLVGLIWILNGIFKKTLQNLIANKKISYRFRHYLGIKPHKKIPEFLLIRIAIDAGILFLFILCLLKIWAVSPLVIDTVANTFVNGFTFTGFKVIPSHIIIALIVFSIIHMVGRLVATYVARRHQFEGELETQVTIATIISYIGFATALIIALLISGVNFTGLALIAGALSVGIGLGLQTIVNNFVSGLILLIERPIKPGDRVLVGDTEGVVKKIRIRSTQISTSSKDDVIVPNSVLITTPIKNYMFKDKSWQLNCSIGVAYGSNVELVKQVLLEIAHQHKQVLQNPPDEPVVLFTGFGESSMNFQLCCVIQDVNKKSQILNDINFAIVKAFEANSISMPFPQRDIHLIDYTNKWLPPEYKPG